MTLRSLIVSMLLSAGAAFAADLTAETYWQLGKARLELAASEWQARIDAAEQAKGDRKVFRAKSEEISREFAGHQRSLHAQYDTTPQGYLRYGSDHSREVESYLASEENAELKRDVQRVRERIQGLMQRHDATAAPMMQEGK